jgi:hypothetical protein
MACFSPIDHLASLQYLCSIKRYTWHADFYLVNIKNWFRDFQELFFIDFLDELGLFIAEKTIFRRSALCRLPPIMIL